MPKEGKTTTTVDEKKSKVDALASKLLGEEIQEPNQEAKEMPSTPPDETSVEKQQEDATPVEKVSDEKQQEYKTYDHMVKVNGKYYNAGEKIPVLK